MAGTASVPQRLTRTERTASVTLGAVFTLRLLGIFLILPVFSVWAQGLAGADPFLVGLALGIYGLTQAVLQIPIGAASDRIGRKPVIVAGLLVFIAGCVLAAASENIGTLIAARALQGAGAVSAAVTAMLSDCVREKLLTRAMAFVGASIGVSFAASLVTSPILADAIGVPGIFLLTAVLCAAAIVAVVFALPSPPIKRFENFKERASLRDVFLHGQLLRLNLGIFSLHMAQMALFVVIPLRLVELGLEVPHHWYVYLPAVAVSLAFLMPAIRHAEKTGRVKELFVGAICLVLAAFAGFEIFDNSVLLISVLLLVFFSGFNVLEASLPSLVSKTAPQECKGLALGVYNTTQSIGVFVGGACGGWLYAVFGTHGVYAFCAALMILWIGAAWGMTPPAPKNAEATS